MKENISYFDDIVPVFSSSPNKPQKVEQEYGTNKPKQSVSLLELG